MRSASKVRDPRRSPIRAGLVLFAALLSGCGADFRPPIDIQLPVVISPVDMSPSWSPDGSRIAYLHYDESIMGVRLVDTMGVATHQILSGYWNGVDWSPDGTHLAISVTGAIYSARATGDSLQVIANIGYAPSWSPTGDQIAFQSYGTTGGEHIWLVSPDGSGLRSLAPSGDGESWSEPDWSPDGTRLVHVRRLSSGQSDLFVMDTSGNAEQQLTNTGADDYGPAWSPDGQWIAWSTGTAPPAGELWLMRADGTEARKLTEGAEPSWSPDSRRIVFSRLMYNVTRLFTIDVATLEVRQITR